MCPRTNLETNGAFPTLAGRDLHDGIRPDADTAGAAFSERSFIFRGDGGLIPTGLTTPY